MKCLSILEPLSPGDSSNLHPQHDPVSLSDASGFEGRAERVFGPEDETAIGRILLDAAESLTPVTIFGAGTGVTGGGVPQEGWRLSLERMSGIGIESGFAICGAGAALKDIQTAAAATGQFYAPDPTEWSASLGGTIATNASGSRSFRYGDTRRHIRAIRVVLASGEVLDLRRGQKVPFAFSAVSAPSTTKNTAGYFLRDDMDYLDLFTGSEGTLGVVTQAEIALLPVPLALFTGVVFFPGDAEALNAVTEWRSIGALRMLEYLDAPSLELLRSREPGIPDAARAALLIEQERRLGDDTEEQWLERLEATGALTDESWFADSARDRERFRRLRHALPEAVNEIVRRRGITKMGSDFAVPIERNREMLNVYRDSLEREFPGQYCIFGHIGDAHLHVNILPADKAEWTRASSLMTQLAREAVALGGTVSAEHGLGKRKKHLLALQFSPAEIEAMRQVKRRLDPLWLLGRGNIFEEH